MTTIKNMAYWRAKNGVKSDGSYDGGNLKAKRSPMKQTSLGDKIKSAGKAAWAGITAVDDFAQTTAREYKRSKKEYRDAKKKSPAKHRDTNPEYEKRQSDPKTAHWGDPGRGAVGHSHPHPGTVGSTKGTWDSQDDYTPTGNRWDKEKKEPKKPIKPIKPEHIPPQQKSSPTKSIVPGTGTHKDHHAKVEQKTNGKNKSIWETDQAPKQLIKPTKIT